MKKMSQLIKEGSNSVDVFLQPLNTELVYITENGKQVGSLLLVYNQNSASIYSVEVLSNQRGKGYGKKLVENAINRCISRGCASIELNTELDNHVANNLYRSMGFQLKGINDSFNNYIKPL